MSGYEPEPEYDFDDGVYDPDGRLIGVYRDDGGKARPLVILAPA